MSCEHRYLEEDVNGIYWCTECRRSDIQCAIDLRARLYAAEKRAAEAEAIANEAMRVGLETCNALRAELQRTQLELLTAYTEAAGGYMEEYK